VGRGGIGVGELEGGSECWVVARGAGVVLTKTWKQTQEILAIDLYFSFDRIRMALSGGAALLVKDIPFVCLWMPSNALRYQY